MKKQFILVVLGLMIVSALSSCFHNHDISISISDDEDEYEMEAVYQRNQTRAIRAYLNEHLLSNNAVSFKSKAMDEEITLDDHTTFYINSYPGELTIKIDKTKNSEESFERVRQACEEIKEILADN